MLASPSSQPIALKVDLNCPALATPAGNPQADRQWPGRDALTHVGTAIAPAG